MLDAGFARSASGNSDELEFETRSIYDIEFSPGGSAATCPASQSRVIHSLGCQHLKVSAGTYRISSRSCFEFLSPRHQSVLLLEELRLTSMNIIIREYKTLISAHRSVMRFRARPSSLVAIIPRHLRFY